MKWINTIFILIVLFGLPLGSWLYLNSGLNFHLKVKESLHPKGELQAFRLQWDTLSSWDSDSLKGYTSLFLFGGAQSVSGYKKFENALLQKMSNRDDLLIIQLLDSSEVREGNPTTMRSVHLDSFLLDQMIQTTFHIPDSLRTHPAVLVDSSLQIRNYYSMQDSAAFVKVLEHLGFLLPPLKRERILLREH